MNRLFFILLLILSSCASTPQTNELLKHPGELPAQHLIKDVPFVLQSSLYCGPASLAMVAGFAGQKVSLEELGKTMFTPGKKGTLQTDFLSAARRLGLVAAVITTLKDLLVEINADHPTVVFLNLASDANPIWHYAVAHGFNLSEETILLNSGSTENLKMDLEQFERVWKKGEYWGIVVLPPEQLPTTSSLTETLLAVAALERVSKFKEAATAYSAVVKKWPESVAGWFGLGNAFAALHQYRKSSDAFKRALKLQPESDAIQSNLKEVTHKLRNLN